jgi:hypothetical protein
MKALSTTLVVAVAAIVIFITAVVVLAIFLNVIPIATGLTEAKAICQTEAVMTCASFGQLPPTWNVQNKKIVKDGQTRDMSCAQVMEENKLSGCTCTGKDKKEFSCVSPTT